MVPAATVLVAFSLFLPCFAQVPAATTIETEKASSLPLWSGAAPSSVPRDLHREYGNIFKHGNRNAASHLWSSFLLDRSYQMDAAKLESMFTAFCAVSGSPVRPSDYNRYRLTLDMVSGGAKRSGYMHYCCWPCVCDTQDFIKVDTKTVLTRDGPQEFHFAVLGNPCLHREQLEAPFVQPFGRRKTTLALEAREVRCGPDDELIGATMSDNGYAIISMFFDSEEVPRVSPLALTSTADGVPTPGRMSQDVMGRGFQDEFEWGPKCEDRAAHGYNSGMGEIFRKVAAISPIQVSSGMEGESRTAITECADEAGVNYKKV